MSEIPDLRIYDRDERPSWFPFHVRLKGSELLAGLPPELTVCMVGWLGSTVPSRGETDEACIERLLQALDRERRFDSDEVFWEGLRGYHECEVCLREGKPAPSETEVKWKGREYIVRGIGHHLVRLDSRVYVCPQLILHYVLQHQYQPPAEFVRAVTEGVFLTEKDLTILPEKSIGEWFEKHHPSFR